MGDKYILRYLPLFYEDLEEKITYISDELANPEAALGLLDAVEAAILKRLPNAESFEQYHSQIDHQYPYYHINVKNYMVFYVIIDDEGTEKIMEVRRFLYKGQNRDEIV